MAIWFGLIVLWHLELEKWSVADFLNDIHRHSFVYYFVFLQLERFNRLDF